MKIQMTRIDGEAVPQLLCELCDKPIRGKSSAMQVWFEPRRGEFDLDLPQYRHTWIIHKGACDIIFSTANKHLGLFMWREMDEFLADLKTYCEGGK